LADARALPEVYDAIVTFRAAVRRAGPPKRRGGVLYRVGFRSANLLKLSLVTSAAMLAICLLALADTTESVGATSLPENGKITFSSWRGAYDAIYTVEPDGSNLKQLTNEAHLGVNPNWSPDGTEITYSEQGTANWSPDGAEVPSCEQGMGGEDIAVMSADGSNLRVLCTNGTYGLDPTWSPDGTKLAYSSSGDIYMMDSDGSNRVNLTKTPRVDELNPAFSPNGSQICFVRGSEIYVMNADGSDLTPLADEHLASQGCDWSPDGTKIAFTIQKKVGGSYTNEDIYVMNADGSGQTNLTRTNTESEREPDWSPDGTRIAFERGWNEDVDIYTMNADGSDVAQLTHSRATDIAPDWQPVPRPTHEKSRSVTVHPPDTGGPSLLLVASVLLISVGVLLFAVVKRRM
jgi:Tol biopolymer transport system component